MELFDFFTQLQKSYGVFKTKDGRKAECPYCQKALSKIPGSKTKCPYCGEFMFVRTKPNGNMRMVVTKNEAEKIEEDWAIVSGTHDSFIAEKERVKTEREILKKRFGKEPSENDVKWGILNKSLIEHAQRGDWGLYRNSRFEMAEILRKELKLDQALQTYLEVCYLDLNGPNNNGGISSKELLRNLLPFEPKGSAFLAPGVIDRIRLIVRKLGVDRNKLRSIFIEHNLRFEKSLRLPLPAEIAWEILSEKF